MSAYQDVFPALAGVILIPALTLTELERFSRTRGGDPAVNAVEQVASEFFPHSRG